MLPKIRTLLPLVNSEEELAASLARQKRFGPRGGMVVWVEGQKCIKIPLNRGMFALVNAADYPLVGIYRWVAHHKGKGRHYAVSDNPQIKMHRLILGFPESGIDHKNRNGLDNRRCNLRLATHTQNVHNTLKLVRNTSGYKGVYRDREHNRWRATLTRGSKRRYLGSYPTAIEAALAYDNAVRESDDGFSTYNLSHK